MIVSESRMSRNDPSCSDDGPDPEPEPKLGSKRYSNSDSSSDSKRADGGKHGDTPINMNFFLSLVFIRVLRSGTFGTVNLMEHNNTKQFYAVKVIKKKDPKTNEKILSEINLGLSLNSDYICKVYGYHEDKEKFYIIMEYLEGMDLFDFICKHPKFFIHNPTYFWFVVEDILRGIAYIHSKRIAHMDIKPENVYILLDKSGNIIGVKLIDFGLSMEVDDTTKCFFRGTDIFMAPDFFHPFSNIGCKVDIWSLGITVFAMIRDSFPIQIASRKRDPHQRKADICRNIEGLLTNNLFNPFEKTSEDPNIARMEDFVRFCLRVYPTDRPDADKLLENISSAIPQMSL